MCSYRRAREIFHECRDGSGCTALRQHSRLIDRIPPQRAGQRASHGDALRDFGEVEEAQLDLAPGDQFAANCERGVARLVLDLLTGRPERPALQSCAFDAGGAALCGISRQCKKQAQAARNQI